MEKFNRLLLKHRRLLIALFAGIAAWSALAALTHEPSYTTVAVAARELDSGVILTARDITEATFLTGTQPAGALPARSVEGRTVAGPMRSGEPFTDHRAIESNKLGSGETLALIELPVAQARILRVGERVDIVSLDSEDAAAATTIASNAAIAVINMPENSSTASLGVAVKPAIAHNIMSTQLHSPLTALPATFP